MGHRPTLRELERMTPAEIERAMVREGWSRETAKAAMERAESSIQRMVAPIRRLIAADNPSVTVIRQTMEALEKRVLAVVEDEIVRQMQDVELELYRDVGVEAFEWVTVEDKRVCDDCSPLDGDVRSMADWGSTIPGTADHVCQERCRCMLIPSAEEAQRVEPGNIAVAVTLEVTP